MFIGIREANYPGWIWTVATRVTDITLMLSFMSNLKKMERNVGYMEIIPYLRIWSITPNDRMDQKSKISFFTTHQTWSLKISKDQDLAVYTLEIKQYSMMKNLGGWGVICGYSLCGLSFPIFLFGIMNALKTSGKKRGRGENTDADTMRVNTLIPVN